MLAKIQELCFTRFHRYKTLYTRSIVSDIMEDLEQEVEIINERNRPYRSAEENKAQALARCYFPQMAAKVKRIIKLCKTWKEKKYDRHFNNISIQETSILQHIDCTHRHLYYGRNITEINKLIKYVQAKVMKSSAAEDIKQPLREMVRNFGKPETVIMDNEDHSTLKQSCP